MQDQTSKRIDQLLKEYRDKTGFTQDELAKVVGKDRKTIGSWEKSPGEEGARKPSDPDDIKKLIEIFYQKRVLRNRNEAIEFWSAGTKQNFDDSWFNQLQKRRLGKLLFWFNQLQKRWLGKLLFIGIPLLVVFVIAILILIIIFNINPSPRLVWKLDQAASGVAVDNNGTKLYLTDDANNRVLKFDINSKKLISQWGQKGNGDGEFNKPEGIAVDSQDNVYVADASSNIVQEFDSEGHFLQKWSSQISTPTAIAVDKQNNIYVVNSGKSQVLKLGSNGSVSVWGSYPLYYPVGITIDFQDNVYVTDTGNSQVLKFDATGTMIKQWGKLGIDDGEFDHPRGIVIDKQGNLYISDYNNHQIKKYDNNGKFIFKWGGKGNGDTQFYQPQGLAVNNQGTIYVVDQGNKRILGFRL